MALDLFDTPLFMQRKHYIQELTGLDDAFDFLEDWPEESRDLAYETVLKECREAASRLRPVQIVREDLRRFLKQKGKLADASDITLCLRKQRGDSFSRR